MDDKRLEQLADFGAKAAEARYAFMRQVLLVCGSLFGILVSLHRVPASAHNARIAFLVAVCSLSLSSVLLSLALFGQVQTLQSLVNRLKTNRGPFVENRSKWHEYAEKLGYISLLTALMSLTVYAILIA